MSTRWVCTDFVCDKSFWEKLIEEGKVKYVGWGEEVCPQSGRKHWQMWLVTSRKEFSGIVTGKHNL